MSDKKLLIAGPCDCGFARVDMPDYLDSGTVLNCLGCGAEIVVDVWTPEVRTQFFAIYEKGLAIELKERDAEAQ